MTASVRENKKAILEHFDRISARYGYYKKRNSYYYSKLKEFYKGLIPERNCQSIVELGCGCGELIGSLNPKEGLGIDFSNKMVDIASREFAKKNNLQFTVGNIEDLLFMKNIFSKTRFDYCIIPDTIEHLSDINRAFWVLSSVVDKNTKIVITSANHIWSPLLMFLERLGLKMPEGPHKWLKMGEIVSILKLNNFKILSKGSWLLIPFNFPFFSNMINSIAHRVPVLNRLCLVQYIIFQAC